MKLTNKTTLQDSLTEFDYRMIQEMKKIPELQNWAEQQLAEYCSILKCYSMLILTSALNDKHNSNILLDLTVTPSQIKQAA